MKKDNTVTILGLDPGSKNFGVAVIKAWLSKPLTLEQQKPKNNKIQLKVLKFEVKHLRKLANRYTELKSPMIIRKETIGYKTEIEGLISEYGVDFMIAERYQSRGMGGVTIELVNQMIGTLRSIGTDTNTPLKVMPASQWKVPLGHQGVVLDDVYAKAKTMFVSDHEVDAAYIGLYGTFTLMRRKPFLMKSVSSLETGLLKAIKGMKRQKPIAKRRAKKAK